MTHTSILNNYERIVEIGHSKRVLLGKIYEVSLGLRDQSRADCNDR
jgi:hypothetical protein